ncbi:MAG TPA: hypothetical protein VF791_08080 [Pyrinomonadaceae bacterium]
MRRFTSLISMILLTLALSGWGTALAAAVCPHAGMKQAQAAVEEDSHCHGKTETAAGHHSASHRKQAIAGKETPHAAHRRNKSAGGRAQFAGTCAHCASHNQFPNALASARELNLKKNDASVAHEQPTRLAVVVSAACAPRLKAVQHAPPGASKHRHLLLNVFLI